MIPKFRVWDKNTKLMWNIERWHVEDEYFDLIEPNKSVADSNANRVWRKQSDVTIMQSAGLHDKHGVEIFEGDIVVDLTNKRYIVKYNKDFCAYFLYPIDNEEKFMAVYPNIVLKIIGNVHENPELLEST